MRKITKGIAAIAAFLLLTAVGCSAVVPGVPEEADDAGGDSTLGENVNLRDVSIEMQGERTVVRMSFVNGSRYAGIEESKISSVPSYEVTQLADPPRIRVSLAIGLTDYTQAGTVFEESVVEGLFDCDIVDSAKRQVYLQLSAPVEVECIDEGSTLTLLLTPEAERAQDAWFVGLNGIAQYMNGLVPAELGFTPTMCDDFASVILISSPVGSEEAAQETLEQALEALPSTVPASALYTFSMDVNALPPYRSVAGSELAAAASVVQIDGVPQSLSVLLDNGRYLATGPDGALVYAVPYQPNAEQDTEQIVKEDVWIARTDGTHTTVGSGDFYDVREAAWSADGRYLGILDAGPTDQILYVYDTLTGALSNLGEEGLGNTTTSFVWDPSGSLLYAMSGTDGALQLLRYDFAAEEGAQRVSAIEERNGSDSAIAFANDTLYFADQTERMIYAVNTATGERRVVAPGVSMRLSGNGRYLAVLTLRPLSEEEYAFDLVLHDAATGAQLASVIENVQIEDFMFDADQDSLYFTTQNYEGVSPEYPFALLRYSISSGECTLVGYSRSELIETSQTPGTLYVVYYFVSDEQEQDMLPVTYVLSDTGA